MKNKHTPLSAAKALRIVFEDRIAKNWDDYFLQQKEYREDHNLHGTFLHSYHFAKLVQEQAKCTFEEAAIALGEVIPELFAEYWDARRL